jgi:hypothetical protein
MLAFPAGQMMRANAISLMLLSSFLCACGGTTADSLTNVQSAGPRLLATVSVGQQSNNAPVSLPYQQTAYLLIPSGVGNLVRLAADPNDPGIFVSPNTVVRFSDTSFIPYAETGSMPEAYRLYRAAFARVPDTAGLMYWISALNSGVSVESIAAGFVNSAEFKSVYGSNPNDPAIITGLYRNVLGREPEVAGLTFWQKAQQDGTPISQILTAFSDSAENKAGTAPQVTKGITFKEDGVGYSGITAPSASIALTVSGVRNVGGKILVGPELATPVSAGAVYSWTLASKPANSQSQANSSAAQLSFVPDVAGTYQVALSIADGGRTFGGKVSITVTAAYQVGKPYTAKSGMTVTLESVNVIAHGENYVDYVVTYVQSNHTQLAIDEGMLKLYLSASSPIPQYGAFNKIFPGDTLRRTYTFTQLKTDVVTVLEYDQDNFFRTAPSPDSLQWAFPFN